MDKTSKLIVFGLAGLFSVMGSIFAAIGIVNGQSTRSFISKAVPTQGTVIDLVIRTSTDSDGDSTDYYHPVIKYTTNSGKEIIFESSSGSYPAEFSSGEQVELLYDPKKPNSAQINSWFDLWGFSAFFTGFGLLFILVGGSLIVIFIVLLPRFEKPVTARLVTTDFGEKDD